MTRSPIRRQNRKDKSEDNSGRGGGGQKRGKISKSPQKHTGTQHSANINKARNKIKLESTKNLGQNKIEQ